MDIVDTFNHLIPSDQLDDALTIGQNLECEASNEFGPGIQLEDSLKNMLSDKDPMFGCSTSQFNLLDNEDSTFQISGSGGLNDGSASTGISGELTVAKPTPFKRPVGRPRKRPHNVELKSSGGPQPANTSTNTVNSGRPGRKPANRLQKSFVIEKGVRGTQLKKELTLGGRININDLNAGLWLNPSVVLRQLTVTIAGFRIELLPGPSYVQNADSGYESGFSYGGDIGFAMLPDDTVSVHNPIPENVAQVDVIEKSCSDETPLGLGPYVNPNDVQTANGTEMESHCIQETKVDNHSVSSKEKPVNNRKDGINQPQHNENNRATASNVMDVKEKPQTVAKNLIKSKPELTSMKDKGLVSCKPSNMTEGSKVSQHMPSKLIQRGDLHKLKSLKEKKDNEPLKRPGENLQSEHATKVQKIQGKGDLKVKPKLPSTPSAVVKKTPPSGNRIADQHSPTKPSHSHNSSKAETANLTHGGTGHSSRTPQEGHEKAKMKKPEKILHRQKSKTARSISLEEPQLFIPDNAPVVKRESTEEQPANSESVWDGNNCCGLCKKHHNNTFMVGCGRCDDWFHGDCVGLDLTKVREMEEEDQMYVCLKCCEEESKKVEPEPAIVAVAESQAKTDVQEHKLAPKHKPGPSPTLTSGGVRPVRKEPDRRSSSEVKEAAHKTGIQLKLETRSKTASSTSKKPVSVEEIRRSVRESLKEILIQRLKESDLSISVERASEVAKKTERELFHLYKDTENKYKNKYRSLMFNLKDTKNNVLFKRVLKGEISPSNLIRMSPEELASKELAAWRQRENRHTIEMIEKEQREVERRPITKITHKGEIEIESQEPVKAPEPEELEPPVMEVSAEPPKTPEKNPESTKTEKDTTNNHKSHLFDLHCKICTGRMAPPVVEAPTKVVKVATTVVRRQSTKGEEGKSATPPAVEEDLHLAVLEESFQKAQTGYEGRSDHAPGRDEEAAFLSSLKSLWRGFIHMHSVAKLVTRAFPVSGVLDNLTQDLPDSVQVGGRITPQIVWDYLEKIRATGTKEVCLIRFSPETEEDEISYTLLYAYFSSRKRFGVVSNNLKQVKDMYIIPLGATEKVPHQLVPFDGPGLENNRPNLLLGLIIRQRPKREFLPVDMNEAARTTPEIKPIIISTKDPRAVEEEEKLYLSSLTTAHTKEKDKQLNTADDVNEPIAESFEEPSVSEENVNQESQKPLRFLPGVLVGWGGELPPLPDFGGKPLTAADDTQTTQPAPKPEASTSCNSKSPTATAPRERFVIKKKEVKAEPEPSRQTDTAPANKSPGKDVAAVPQSAPVSLKDKPPDVSTEAFLASLSETQGETSCTATTNKGATGLLSEPEEGKPEPKTPPDHTSSSKPPLSGILKKSSAYSSTTENRTTLQKDKTSHAAPLDSKPVPVSSSSKNNPVTPFHQGFLQISRAVEKTEEKKQTTFRSFLGEKEDPVGSLTDAAVTPTVHASAVQAPQSECCTATHTEALELEHDTVKVTALPDLNSSTSFPVQQLQPQVPGSSDNPSGPLSDPLHNPDQSDDTSQAPPGHQYPESCSEPSVQPPSLAKDYKQDTEEQYSDPWDRDHHGRHSHHRDSHHGKKSRHHDREREKKHDHRHDDKYRERSRHRGHSDDRYDEKKWKERLHGDDRHKDRYRHRRDSDHENGRRSSKDSY